MKAIFLVVCLVAGVVGCAGIQEVSHEPTGMCLKTPYIGLMASVTNVSEGEKMDFLKNIQITADSNAFPLFESADRIPLYWDQSSPRICPEVSGVRHCVDISSLPACEATKIL